MTRYHQLHQFTDAGLVAFRCIFTGQLPEDALDPCDPQMANRLIGTGGLDDAPAATARAMADRLLAALGDRWEGQLANTGLWAWLTFVLRDLVVPRRKDGKRHFGEVHRWDPADPNNYLKAQRHLVRMPVLLRARLGDAADHLLCGDPAVPGEVREQLIAQQDMFTPRFQAAARALYFDPATGGLKRGASGKTGGAARRLRTVRRQLDVTWSLFDLTSDEILRLLPAEFDRFKPA